MTEKFFLLKYKVAQFTIIYTCIIIKFLIIFIYFLFTDDT